LLCDLDALPTQAVISLKRARDFPVRAPHSDFSLGFVALHLFVLRKFDCGGGLIFRRAAVDFILNGVAQTTAANVVGFVHLLVKRHGWESEKY